MTKADKIAEAAKRILAKLSGEAPKSYKFMKEGVTTDGVKVFTEADDFIEGAEVFVEVDGVVSPAPDGEHTIEGIKIVVKDGKIESVATVTEEVAAAESTDAELEAVIEAALSSVVADRDKYAAELTAKNDAIARIAAELSAKESEITNLKAQVTTLSKQIGSVQDSGVAKAATSAPSAPKLDANGRPANWGKLTNSERFAWNKENLTLKFK